MPPRKFAKSSYAKATHRTADFRRVIARMTANLDRVER
jgi:hypothetical protein